MKRLIVFALILALSFTFLASCGKPEEEYTLYLGVKATVKGTSVSETVAAVVTDGDGKIVQCRIDVIDFSAKVDNRGDAIVTKPITKREQGDDYGMAEWAPAGEWYKQAEHFEKYVVGMTLEDVKSIGLVAGKGEDADLLAGCTIAVSDFVDAVTKALEGNNKYTFSAKGDITSAVSAIASVSAAVATDESGNEDPTKLTFSFQTDFGAVASAKGRVAGALVDSIEIKVSCDVVDSVDNENNPTKALSVTSTSNRGTKFELGDNYGMAKYDPDNVKGEWYVQATELAKASIGYETKKLSVFLEDNVAGCNMYVDGYKAALIKAAETAR